MWSITVIVLSFFLKRPHFSPANQSGQDLIPSCLYTTFFTDVIDMSNLMSTLSEYCRKQRWRQGQSGALNDAFWKSGA